MKNRQDRSGTDRRFLSEINVTPFVDVMLVLLIIFMVTAPMLQQSIDISLPQARTSGSPISKKPLIVKIKKNKKIYIGNTFISKAHLSKKLKALFEHKLEKAVYLQADKSIPYGLVAHVLGEIKSSGIKNVSLITRTK